MGGDFSFELQGGPGVVVLYSLQASHSTAADMETVNVEVVCACITQHWGCCQSWRLCVLSGTGIRSCAGGVTVSDISASITSHGSGRAGSAEKGGKSQLNLLVVDPLSWARPRAAKIPCEGKRGD